MASNGSKRFNLPVGQKEEHLVNRGQLLKLGKLHGWCLHFVSKAVKSAEVVKETPVHIHPKLKPKLEQFQGLCWKPRLAAYLASSCFVPIGCQGGAQSFAPPFFQP